MNWIVRLVLSGPLLAVSGFCLFGFIATFEPLPPMQQWIWRAVYCTVALLCSWAIVRLWRSKRPTPSGQNAPPPNP